MSDWIPGDAVNAGGHIHLVDAIDAAQFLGGDLAGCCLFAGTGRGKGEDAARPHSKNTADDALLAHAHAHQRMAIAFPGQELDHGHVVGEGGRGADHFVEIGWVSQHLLQSFIQFLGGAEVMERQNQSRARA